jgi:hypothetical protein
MKNVVFWDVALCSSTSQKTTFFIVTAVKASNLTFANIFTAINRIIQQVTLQSCYNQE